MNYYIVWYLNLYIYETNFGEARFLCVLIILFYLLYVCLNFKGRCNLRIFALLAFPAGAWKFRGGWGLKICGKRCKPLKNLWPICLPPMDDFATFLDFSFLSFFFCIFLHQNFFEGEGGKGNTLTENLMRDTSPCPCLSTRLLLPPLLVYLSYCFILVYLCVCFKATWNSTMFIW